MQACEDEFAPYNVTDWHTTRRKQDHMLRPIPRSAGMAISDPKTPPVRVHRGWDAIQRHTMSPDTFTVVTVHSPTLCRHVCSRPPRLGCPWERHTSSRRDCTVGHLGFEAFYCIKIKGVKRTYIYIRCDHQSITDRSINQSPITVHSKSVGKVGKCHFGLSYPKDHSTCFYSLIYIYF